MNPKERPDLPPGCRGGPWAEAKVCKAWWLPAGRPLACCAAPQRTGTWTVDC